MAYFEGEIPTVVSGGNNNGGYGNGWGDSAWWIIILLIFGWGNNGWGNNGGTNGTLSGILTRGDLCMDMNFNDLQNGVRNISDAVNTGFANLNSTICNQQYDTASMLNNLGNTINTNLNAMNIANLQSTNAIQSQLATCCCDLSRGIERLGCEMSTNTSAIIQAGNNNTQRILDYLCSEKISSLQAENALLTSQLSQNAQTKAIVDAINPPARPSFIVPNPYTGTYGYTPYSGYGCGCACNASVQ